MRNFFVSVLKFGGVSLCGLMLDITVYATLTAVLLVRPGFSNVVSSVAAISLVYLLSGKAVFKQQHISGLGYVLWLSYQILSLSFFSLGIEGMVQYGLAPLWAKCVTIPFTFATNFCAISVIFRACHCEHR